LKTRTSRLRITVLSAKGWVSNLGFAVCQAGLDGCLDRPGFAHYPLNLGSQNICLISGDSEGCEDSNDGYDNHQLYEREASRNGTMHGRFLPIKKPPEGGFLINPSIT
jgi:hypothetical protein